MALKLTRVTFESNDSAGEKVILGVVAVDVSDRKVDVADREVDVADDEVKAALKANKKHQ